MEGEDRQGDLRRIVYLLGVGGQVADRAATGTADVEGVQAGGREPDRCPGGHRDRGLRAG